MGELENTVAFVTMGCAKNEVDSDHMAERLVAAGYVLQDDPERADVVVINTCSFIQEATEESIDAILEVAGYDNVRIGGAQLVVAGCMPSRYGADLQAELPEAGAFVPCADETSIVDVIDSLFGIERLPGDGTSVPVAREQLGERAFAYVKISDGCDRFCAYCAIPSIRGRYHSFSYEEIQAEVERCIGLGAREIVLIAQDTGRWGRDFPEPSSLAWLMARLAERFSSTWFRVMYIQPEGVTDDLIEVIAGHENICAYFDIPFQHANRRILKSMNRTGSAEEHLALITRIRERIPEATLRTTVIVGYPGETDEDFDELCSFIEDAELDYVGSFAYSREEGTRAHDLPGQVDDDEKLSRLQAVRDLADSVCTARIAQRCGSSAEVLICGSEEDGQLFGRTMSQAPDVDGVTYVDSGDVGEIVRVIIEDTLLYEMEGTVL